MAKSFVPVDREDLHVRARILAVVVTILILAPLMALEIYINTLNQELICGVANITTQQIKDDSTQLKIKLNLTYQQYHNVDKTTITPDQLADLTGKSNYRCFAKFWGKYMITDLSLHLYPLLFLLNPHLLLPISFVLWKFLLIGIELMLLGHATDRSIIRQPFIV